MQINFTDQQKSYIYDEAWENTSVGKCLSTPDGRFLDCNQQFAEMLGTTRQGVLSSTWIDITPEPIRSIDLESARAVAKGEVIYKYKLPKPYKLNADAPEIYVLMRVLGVFSEGRKGEFVCYYVEFLPLTRRAYLQAIREMLKSHLTALGAAPTESGLSRLLPAKISLKELITFVMVAFLMTAVIRVGFVSDENLPAVLEKLAKWLPWQRQ